MGTPFISFLEPSKLDGYKIGAGRDQQPASIPQTFLDAMEIREDVFVSGQNISLENEFGVDDHRCCHWVAYASVHKTEEHEVRDDAGNVIQPRKSSTRTTPIGTIRLTPFPHKPHPRADGQYWNGVLEGDEAPSIQTETEGKRTFVIDRPTTHHDGKEPFVKIDRLAVQKEFRGNKIARLLVNTVLVWLKANPSYFDPSITEMGLEQMGATRDTEIPSWNGLVCVHAQEQAKETWEKWGFKADQGMGKWWEDGIPHIGMFQRLKIGTKQMRIY